MKREKIKYPLDEFIKELIKMDKNVIMIDVELYLDKNNSDDILDIISKDNNKKVFRRIVYLILQNKFNKDLYSQEKIDKRNLNITAMKFQKKNNERIYCKEFYHGRKKVVMIFAVKKKSQKINKKIRGKLENIGGYKYEWTK